MVGNIDDQENWIKKYNNPDQSIESIYIDSIYWAVTTMITVGYGDIVPVNTSEKLFTMAVMMLACGVFAYTVI